MLSTHTYNKNLLQHMIELEFAQVTPSLLSHVPAIQHQRHLHLGFNKHSSRRRNCTLMRHIKYAQQLKWEWNSPELQNFFHYYQKHISITWQTFMWAWGALSQCNSFELKHYSNFIRYKKKKNQTSLSFDSLSFINNFTFLPFPFVHLITGLF